MKGGKGWGTGHWSEFAGGNGSKAAQHGGVLTISNSGEARRSVLKLKRGEEKLLE
jgi:hypothetical protein